MLVSGPLSQEAASLTSMVTSSTLPYDVHFEAMLSHSWVICARSVLGVPSCRCDDASEKAGVSYNPVVFMCQLTKTTIFLTREPHGDKGCTALQQVIGLRPTRHYKSPRRCHG